MPKLRELTSEEIAIEIKNGCELLPPACELGNSRYKVLMLTNLKGERTNLEQTVQLLKSGMTKNEIQDMTGCGDLVGLVKN